ncbi:hypothetical protein [Hanstruepera marina]|uniref:hypothetical protein n=1 Tax=Hanstruepera marina TaxID=2873265 RepID=UPI001CA6F8A6|nr:hypothetical protein [Hanstruepera marina]
MKKLIILFACGFLILACKSDKKENQTKELIELTPAEKIANRYGFQNWNNVEYVTFRFNVTKDSSHFQRLWEWNPKTNDVVLITQSDTLKYNRNKLDDTFINADKAFINDKYWLLAPFNLVWDSGTTISEPEKSVAPLSNKELNKLTLTYSNTGGYTPGDAYDFYFTDEYVIEEWVYRKGNTPQPSMMTTWEDNQEFNGILISKSHKKTTDNWELYFSDVEIK